MTTFENTVLTTHTYYTQVRVLVTRRYIQNPNHDRCCYTRVNCGDGLAQIINRNWSTNELIKFDNIMCQHVDNIFHDEIFESYANYLQSKHLYDEMLKELITVDKEYKELKIGVNKDEFIVSALKSKRYKIYKELVDMRVKLSKYYPDLFKV